MNRLQASHRNVGAPQERYKGAREIKGSIRVESIWYKAEVKASLRMEYLWQSDKFIVVTKAAKAVGTKGLGYCRFTQEKQPERPPGRCMQAMETLSKKHSILNRI